MKLWIWPLTCFFALIVAACGSDGGGGGGSADTDTDTDSDSDSDTDTDSDGPVTVEVEVPAEIYWVNSGLYVREGEEITITANGSWTIWEGTVDEYGPDGLSYDVYGCMHGELVAMVGLHWNDEQICVGADAIFAAPRDGILYLAANDGGREDNAGTVTVEITSESDLTPTIQAGEIADFDYGSVSADMIELAGDNIILTLSTSNVAGRPDDAEAALDAFEAWYELHEELASAVPYNGQHVRYYPDPDIYDIGAWGLSGNPIRIMQEEGFLD
ncbi:MAG: hypothetical protein JRF63_11360, partial [Deltaproteobacteria bacterium]|nr:hypothetical protein [Deltaproteobacteria bacterium]